MLCAAIAPSAMACDDYLFAEIGVGPKFGYTRWTGDFPTNISGGAHFGFERFYLRGGAEHISNIERGWPQQRHEYESDLISRMGVATIVQLRALKFLQEDS